jgi:hypothetical protein
MNAVIIGQIYYENHDSYAEQKKLIAKCGTLFRHLHDWFPEPYNPVKQILESNRDLTDMNSRK